jgi:hypothetical protein
LESLATHTESFEILASLFSCPITSRRLISIWPKTIGRKDVICCGSSLIHFVSLLKHTDNS